MSEVAFGHVCGGFLAQPSSALLCSYVKNIYRLYIYIVVMRHVCMEIMCVSALCVGLICILEVPVRGFSRLCV